MRKTVHDLTEKFSKEEPPGHQTDLTKTELPHDILSLKQQAQRIEEEY
jgi:hypothetical protein